MCGCSASGTFSTVQATSASQRRMARTPAVENVPLGGRPRANTRNQTVLRSPRRSKSIWTAVPGFGLTRADGTRGAAKKKSLPAAGVRVVGAFQRDGGLNSRERSLLPSPRRPDVDVPPDRAGSAVLHHPPATTLSRAHRWISPRTSTARCLKTPMFQGGDVRVFGERNVLDCSGHQRLPAPDGADARCRERSARRATARQHPDPNRSPFTATVEVDLDCRAGLRPD
jgi:hypothetical protein